MNRKRSWIGSLLFVIMLTVTACAETGRNKIGETEQGSETKDGESMVSGDVLETVSVYVSEDTSSNKETEYTQEGTSSTVDLDALDSESVTKLSVWAWGEEIFTENKEVIAEFFEVIKERELLEEYEALEGDVLFNVYVGEEKIEMYYQNNVLRTLGDDYKLRDTVNKEIIAVYNAICHENDVEGYVVELPTT